jgi:uncharacterized protein (TIGR03086 family)
MSDALNIFTKLADDFGARVAATDDGAWANQSPCDEWTARGVVEHVVNNMHRVAAGATDGEPATMGADEDPKAAWGAAFAKVVHALGQPGALDKVVSGPMGMQMPLSQMLQRFICTDTLVHTWDLARAVGGDERLDADAVTAAYSGLKPMDAMIRNPGFFGGKAEAADDADEQAQFLAFLGRKV